MVLSMVLILSSLLLAIHSAGAGVLIHRTRWRDYPAFMSYLAYSIVAGALALKWYEIVITAGLPLGILLRCWIIVEDYQQTRSQWPRREAIITGSLALGLALVASVGAWVLEDRPLIGNVFAAGQYPTLALMGFSWAITIRAHWWPMLERRRNRAYRWGVTAILTILGISSTFGRYALAYGVLHHTQATWEAVRLAVTASLALTVTAMVVGMAWPETVKRCARFSGSCRRSNVIEIRKAA